MKVSVLEEAPVGTVAIQFESTTLWTKGEGDKWMPFGPSFRDLLNHRAPSHLRSLFVSSNELAFHVVSFIDPLILLAKANENVADNSDTAEPP